VGPRRRRAPQRSLLAADAAAPSSGGAEYRGPDSFPEAAAASGGGPGGPQAAEDAAAEDAARNAAEVLLLVGLLPPRVRAAVEAHPRVADLIEVVLDLGRPPLARFPGGDATLSAAPVSRDDLAAAVALCGDFGGDNRAGIDATLHRISAIRNRAGAVVGLTCRVGRAVGGSAAMVADLVVSGKSILLLGRPGVGKTTAIREISRLLADDHRRRVVIVDTSNEIGGDGDVPHPGVGRARRMQVPLPEAQHRVMVSSLLDAAASSPARMPSPGGKRTPLPPAAAACLPRGGAPEIFEIQIFRPSPRRAPRRRSRPSRITCPR
jgi:hypothetical protein